MKSRYPVAVGVSIFLTVLAFHEASPLSDMILFIWCI